MNLKQAYRGGCMGRPGWWLALEFDEDTVARLKSYQQGTHRAWDPQNKRWWISDDIAELVAEFVPALKAHLQQLPLL